ncbi:hypothetical protein Hanom_Chr12g01125081 [Helianthus anomalus]
MSSITDMLAVVVNRHGFDSMVGFAITDESEGVALAITTLVKSIHEGKEPITLLVHKLQSISSLFGCICEIGLLG